MDPARLEQFKTLLEKEAARLTRELAAFAASDPAMRDDWDASFPRGAPLGATASHSSQEEQADIREEYETGLAQEQTLEVRLSEVKRALLRVADGTFGLCRECEKTIPEERLLANPAAEYDIEHQPRE
ncbi:MAG: TraR/DksA C4-type zinc finger protein [Candidatus Sungbacteria bacterium]|uniref:TraR/DksA C4-type zinc finger protein n=1 Tax=Candidatus Sungiibacteriota bacterium TaxID=2750080 RepID=A0A932YZC5_9BACT|nr:TraR/DksA C4-type zinc finger protein [Candidatus Sungbacteria bacterium]